MQLERKPRGLPGHMDSINSGGRRAILESSERVAIAYGNLENPLILVDKVNTAMLRHYIPAIVNDFYYATSIESDGMILLPSHMTLVTERGVKQVVRSMLQELQRGSYPGKAFTKDMDHEDRYMIRPHFNVVNNIHALNTLRAFGLDHDAGFLARKDGPIMVGLKLEAQHWTGGPGSLKRHIDTFDPELLVGQDKELLDEARAVYEEWCQSRGATAGSRNKA
ncbi:hypothetical protein SLS64_009035 [Diaporthe eres]